MTPQVGILVVSHSAPLAEAAVALAQEVATGPLRLAVAAGVDDPEHPFGTDPTAVLAAVEALDSPAGVLVLMDLGSAVLSAELAVELLPEDVQGRVRLSAAPLVEGLVAAAVQAAAGADLDRVAREAEAGLAGKRMHLGSDRPDATPAPPVAVSPDGTGRVGEWVVGPAHGLHARPAARLASILTGLDVQATATNSTAGRGPVDASSTSLLVGLGLVHGHTLRLQVSGPEADAALEAVTALAADNFGDPVGGDTPPPDTAPTTHADDILPGDDHADDGPVLHGRRAAGGLALGPAVRAGDLPRTAPPVPDGPVDAATEHRRLAEALAEAGAGLAATQARVAAHDPAAAEILQAHRALLTDPALTGPATDAIDRGAAAATAWWEAVDAVAATWAGLEDPHLAARVDDIRAVGAEVLAHLVDTVADDDLPEGVLVADTLLPTDAARLDPDRTTGVVLAAGSPTAHAALLLAARGIPTVVGVGARAQHIEAGTCLLVDADRGVVVLDPTPSAQAHARDTIAARAVALADQRAAAQQPARTRDGTVVAVAANVGIAADADRAAVEGADGVGLLRTELRFVDRDAPPDEEEQVAAYTAVCAALPGRHVVMRTLDVGGDKPLAYLPLPQEDNPFLGLRGLRVGLDRPELLATQLRAAVRVAAHHPLQVMVPMASTVEELRRARSLLDAQVEAVAAAGHPVPDRVAFGAMVEVPALALHIDAVVEVVDFLSVGTNDLTQYVLAAERGNPHVSHLADPLDPAVLRLLRQVTDVAAPAEVPVAVCGDLAADRTATALLLGLGVGELSVPPPMVGPVKAAVREVDLPTARQLAESALRQPSAAAVRALLPT